MFLGARWLSRRSRQARLRGLGASSSATSTTSIASTTAQADEKEDAAAVICDATLVDLRRFDGVVVDQQLHQNQQHAASRIAAAAAAATTGADWRGVGGGARPLTPRTPRHVDIMGVAVGGAQGVVDGPTTTTTRMTTKTITKTTPVRIFTPDKIAPTRGLGERAWHRRRLSVSFPPPAAGPGVVVAAAKGVGEDVKGLDGRGLPPSQSSVVGRSWCTEEEDESLSSWAWTLSTEEGGSVAEKGLGGVGEEVGEKEG